MKLPKPTPVTRLALSYLAIIMVMSVGFSFFLYNVSSTALTRQLRRQEVVSIRQTLPAPPGYASIEDFRQNLLSDELENVAWRLILFNVGTLLVGAAASYALAVSTLRPITEAMDAQSRFTADASHELRTPLTAMQTGIEVALRDPKLTKQEAAELLKSNLEEVGKLRSLADALLRLARHDDIDQQSQSIQLESAINEALKRVVPTAETKQIKIVNNLQPVPVIVKGDFDSLRELVVVLLDNAIKYSESGTTVTCEVRPHNKFAWLVVKDEGHGIKASDQPHIFERFFRVDPSRSKEKAGGYGLGLSIAKQIVDRHHGTISVKSEPGRGSAFTVKLPILATTSNS